MHKTKGRHRAPRRRFRFRFRLPLWAGALLLAFDAMHEMNAAVAAQLAARDGAL